MLSRRDSSSTKTTSIPPAATGASGRTGASGTSGTSHFLSKLSDSETEAAETQAWIEFAVKCGYLDRDKAAGIYKTYDEIIGTIVGMINHPETWILR